MPASCWHVVANRAVMCPQLFPLHLLFPFCLLLPLSCPCLQSTGSCLTCRLQALQSLTPRAVTTKVIYGSNKNWGCKILFPPLMIWYICSQWSGSQMEQIFIGARKWAVRLSNFQWWILEPIGSTECSDLCPLEQLLFGEQQTPSWNCLIFTVAKKTQFCHGPCWISYLCVNKEDFALS